MKKVILYLLPFVLICQGIRGYAQTTFTYTGAVQTYTVPVGASAITVDVQGAMGGGISCAYTDYQTLGGCGGRVQATINVTPGHVLNINVGQKPAATGAGGYGGGGNDNLLWTAIWPGAGGGGATTITDATAGTTLVIAGGGGGGGGDICSGDNGGVGGGLIGGTGNSYTCGVGGGGIGGSQVAGGAGSTCDGTGAAGALGVGGNCPASAEYGSGGGGGGYYGGGSGSFGAGGGGGSSYTNPTYTIDVIHTQGYNCANGTAIINIACNAGTITGTNAICTGTGTTTLTDATTGGTWSSSNTSVGVVGTTGIVTIGGAGTTTISYTLGGCSATSVVTVYTMPTAILGTLSVCQGLTTSLSDAVGGGTFTTTAGTGSISSISGGIITGGAAGTATVTYTTGGACYQTAIVTINASPTTILGTANVCVGLTTSLSDALTGGTWSSSNTGIATVGLSTGLVTGISGGTATITYITSGDCSITATVTVNAAPSAINGPTSVCQGSTMTLTDAVAGGTWHSSATGVATIGLASGLVTGIAGGTTIITYTSTNCTPVTMEVTVNPVDPILGTPVVCTGVSTTLSNAIGGGTWTSSNTAVATIDLYSGFITGYTAGTSTIIYTFTTGCIASAVLTVNLSPVAISGTTTLCYGTSATFIDGTSGGTWSSTATTIATIGSATGFATAVTTTGGVTVISYVMPVTGCNAITTLTVNPQPGIINGVFTVCTGLTTTLTDATAGGSWNDNDPIGGPISGSGTVTGVLGGTAIVSYTLPTGCYVTQVVTINSSPAAIAGNHSMCVGVATPLTDPSGGGGGWSSTNTVVGTIGSVSGIVSPLSAGTSVISYVYSTGCNAATVVTVNPDPLSITGTLSSCAGYFVPLSDASSGGTWSSSNTTVATIGSVTGLLYAAATGITDISYSYTSTGCAVDTVFTVNPSPVAISGTPDICAGLTATFNDATAGGLWSSSNTNASVGSTSGVVMGNDPGTATIIYTLPTTCFVTSPVTITTLPTAIGGPSAVCHGSTVTPTDGTAGGTWTVSGVSGTATISPSGVLTGLTPGGVVASYTTLSCNAVSYPVLVGPLPDPITGIGNLCLGSGTSLTDATPGGAWSSSNAGATVSSTGVVSGVDTGSGTTITYTLPTTCYVTAPVIVFPIPAPIMGVYTVCPGSSVVLSDNTPAGVWSSSNGTLARSIALTGEVDGLVSGTVNISYTLISGCYVTAPFTVETALPASLTVTQTPDTLLCANQMVTFTAHPVNGGVPTFEWENWGSYVGMGSTYTFVPAHGDYITCVMTTDSICASPSVVETSVVMNVYPLVSPEVVVTTFSSDSASYLGEVYTFYTDVTYGGVAPAYQWYVNSAAIAGATNSTFTTNVYQDNDSVTCVVTGTSPCDTITDTGQGTIIIYGMNYLSVSSLSAGGNDLTLFPNPNSGSFILSGAINSGTGKDITLEITDMTGRTIYEAKTTPQNGSIHAEIKLDNDIAAGTYLLRVYTESGLETFHFVVGK